ncbi:MAG TPA: serine/threonine-protein kinase [Kofleriaceae bacterium]|jgi:serine/threonine-protein kinase|nr:serine/threonine-protein kinase [Kofleriaceae bacterium]
MSTGPKAPRGSEAPPLAVKVGDVVLERYRIVEHIASGGHSVVFRGQDERLSRPVCIKVFSGMGGNSGVGRTSYEHFVQEAFALSRLTHPNTLRIFDFGHLGTRDAEGMPLQVCEYMNGGTLSHVVREQGRQSLAETARVISAMCLALAEAHTLGIVHRDIKPQNILFGAVAGSKLPKLADFGIAKWSADDDNRQQRAEDTAIVAGQKLAMYSPSWAAPEQLAGQPVSPATDIYSLACVAVYMLSGKAIFADEDVYAGYRKRRHGGDLVVGALQPLDVPAAVIEVLAKALAFDPKHRLARVDDLAQQLTAAIDPPAGIPAGPPAAEAARPPAEPAALVPPPGPGSPGAIPHTAPPPQQTAPRPEPTPPPQPLSTSWAPPAAVTPWMLRAPVPSIGPQGGPQGIPHRLPLSDLPQLVGDRRVHYLHAPNQVADLIGSHNSKVRVTFQSGPTGGRVLHLKGLTCFIAPLGGRPSPAVQLDQASDVALVTPRAQEIGHIRVATGTPGAGHTVFAVGGELVSVRLDDCIDAILFDFGPGSEAYFVYTRGRPIPKSRRG